MTWKMHRSQMKYFAFTYRFSFSGRRTGEARVHEGVKT